MDHTVVTYRHRRGFGLSTPPGWEVIEDLDDTVALALLEPEAPAGFRANIVVTLETVDDDIETWQQTIEEQLAQNLPQYTVIDRERVNDRLIRRLGHYVADATGPVTMEQWATVRGMIGYVVTASVATLSYDSLTDLFTAVADSFQPTVPTDRAEGP